MRIMAQSSALDREIDGCRTGSERQHRLDLAIFEDDLPPLKLIGDRAATNF